MTTYGGYWKERISRFLSKSIIKRNKLWLFNVTNDIHLWFRLWEDSLPRFLYWRQHSIQLTIIKTMLLSILVEHWNDRTNVVSAYTVSIIQNKRMIWRGDSTQERWGPVLTTSLYARYTETFFKVKGVTKIAPEGYRDFFIQREWKKWGL